MDDGLLQQVAEARGMPASLVERSAQARADKTGATVEAVLKEWLGEAKGDTSAADVAEPVEAAPAPTPTPTPTPTAAAVAEAESSSPVEVTIDYLVELAAQARRMPPKLILSSAEARAEHSGSSLDKVLADWADVDLDALREQAANGDAPAVPAPEPTAASDSGTDETDPAASSETSPVAAAAAVVAGAAMSMDELLAKVAEAKKMPASLAKRSAEARSKKTGEPVEAVLAEWAGVDPSSISPAAPAPATEATEPSPVSEVAPSAVVAGAAMSMDELLAKVAEAKKMPASLAKRSAEARSKKTGEPVEAVLAEWAGVDPSSISPAAPAPATEPDSAATTTPDSVDESDGEPAVVIIEAAADVSDTSTPEATGASTKRGRYPAWLAAAFILIPILAVTYILVSPNGPDCGSGGQLLVDPVTGEAINCDGSAYGETAVDNFAAGGALYNQCVACHSGDGSGGVGPAFSAGAILVTFPSGSCADQVEWVSLGTAGWPDPTYGATNKAVGGVGLMPGFGSSLTEEQVAQVALYERVAFGGQPLEEAEVDCGLIEAEEG